MVLFNLETPYFKVSQMVMNTTTKINMKKDPETGIIDQFSNCLMSYAMRVMPRELLDFTKNSYIAKKTMI